MLSSDLAVASVRDNLTLILQLTELAALHSGESPLVGNNHLLTSGKLVLGTTKCLQDVLLNGVPGADRQKDLPDADASNKTLRLTVCTSHTSLQTIGACARQHLVDTQHMPWVDTNTEMERVLSSSLGDVLVARNTGSFKCLGAELFLLEGHM